MSSEDPRSALANARRVVVKIGSRSLIASPGRFEALAGQIAALGAAGKASVVVSSGAIALGYPRLGFDERPTRMADLQASAAAGQSLLMHAYEQAFEAHGLHVAQVLLTHAGLADRDRYLNARAALDALVERGCVPIINENDTVSVEEIQFGDNDQLAAMVATLTGADVLVLLTDVEGLLDDQGQRISVVQDMEAARGVARPHEGNGVSSGGMPSKLEAARRATLRGVPVAIADARNAQVLEQLFAGEDVGTLVLPEGETLASRKHWIAYTLKPRGAILVDRGAAAALRGKKGGLLPAGVVGVRGSFGQGEAVSIVDPDGKEFARGLCRYGVQDVARIAGARGDEIEGILGRYAGAAVVHQDDLVLV